MMQVLLQLLRVRQWNKNLFLFVPLVFSKSLFEWQTFLEVLLGFTLFSLASSSVYIFNDIQDKESDRQHPRKRFRPIASGRVSFSLSILLMILLGGISLSLSYLLKPAFGLVVLLYIIINITYSIILKDLVILDVMAIAAGFLLRVIAGAELAEIYPSNWLIICTILLSLFLGFGKRRHEILLLRSNANSHRRVLTHYSTYFLDQMIIVISASTVISYMLYTVSQETVQFFGTKRLIWTIPFVLYGIFRYLYLIHQKEGGGDPAEMMFQDKPLLVNILLWGMSCISIIYFFK